MRAYLVLMTAGVAAAVQDALARHVQSFAIPQCDQLKRLWKMRRDDAHAGRCVAVCCLKSRVAVKVNQGRKLTSLLPQWLRELGHLATWLK